MKKIILFLLLPTICLAAPPQRQNSYTPQTTIRAADVTANENAIFNYLQSGVDTFSDNTIVNADINSAAAISYSKLNLSGSITNADIVSAAGIPYSKLTLTGTIVNADIGASAAIVDTKLAQITTASKVSGAAITSLTSLPSGAGIIPVANLGSGTPSSANFLRGDGAFATVPLASNVIYNWGGFFAADTGDINTVYVVANNTTTTTGSRNQYITSPTTSDTLLKSKWIKTSGVSTVTCLVRAWNTSGSTSSTITVNVGGQTGTSAAFTSTTPAWLSSFTVDVSSLINGTTYDISISTSAALNAVSNVVLLVS